MNSYECSVNILTIWSHFVTLLKFRVWGRHTYIFLKKKWRRFWNIIVTSKRFPPVDDEATSKCIFLTENLLFSGSKTPALLSVLVFCWSVFLAMLVFIWSLPLVFTCRPWMVFGFPYVNWVYPNNPNNPRYDTYRIFCH